MVENCRKELIEGAYIQTEAEILSAPMEEYYAINGLMVNILEYL
jgi:hypothetical protein